MLTTPRKIREYLASLEPCNSKLPTERRSATAGPTKSTDSQTRVGVDT
jgi:hypothetical protein